MKKKSCNDIRLQRVRVAVKLMLGLAIVFSFYVGLSHFSSRSSSPDTVATLEIDTSKIEEGRLHTILWNDRPVLIYHRKASEVAQLGSGSQSLADEKSLKSTQPGFAANPWRSLKQKWFVALNQGSDFGCTLELKSDPASGQAETSYLEDTCRRSRYDLAGRVYQGQLARKNLVVPPYSFDGDALILGVE